MHNLQEKMSMRSIGISHILHLDKLPFTQNVSFLNLKACQTGVTLTLLTLYY